MIDRLTRKIVYSKKDNLYSLIYLLITLVLILPVVMTTVKIKKKTFLTMNLVKNRL